MFGVYSSYCFFGTRFSFLIVDLFVIVRLMLLLMVISFALPIELYKFFWALVWVGLWSCRLTKIINYYSKYQDHLAKNLLVFACSSSKELISISYVLSARLIC